MRTREPVIISGWSEEWPQEFRDKASALRNALGPIAIRIDHIGSTSITGLDAKPVIDIQISVNSFEPFDQINQSMERAGYVWRSENPQLTKRYFRERPGNNRTHIHVRRAGSWHEQWALLFRDYMRAHPEEHIPYADLKHRLVIRYGEDRSAYTEGKADFFWRIIRLADRWAALTDWQPPKSDA